MPWSINAYAALAGEIILQDRAYQRATWQWLQEEGARFYAQLQEMAGLTVWPGRANYLFLRCDRADFDLQYALLRQHVLIRSCANYPGGWIAAISAWRSAAPRKTTSCWRRCAGCWPEAYCRMTPPGTSPADAAAASGRRYRSLPAAIAEIRRHADGGPAAGRDAAAVCHVETIEPALSTSPAARQTRLRQQLLAGNGADGRCFAQQLRVAALAGLLYFLPRQLQPGGVCQQARLARQLVIVGGAQRQRALQH